MLKKNEPDEVLLDYLKKKSFSVQARIQASTGLDIRPIYYCAGYKEEGGEQCKPYNLTKLLYYIIQSIPKEKRLVFADHINANADMWLHDDKENDYKQNIKKGFLETIGSNIVDGADIGSSIGEALLGIPGKAAGSIIGETIGAVIGFFDGIFGKLNL